MRNIALKLMYNGTAYHGWQVQKNAVTVCETLQKALEKITGAPVHLTGCGRTDAGVHAERYIANFRTESRIPLERLPFAINTHTPEDIAVSEALEVAEDFNAIGSCLKKEYTYRIYNSRVKNPFYVNRAYFYPEASGRGISEPGGPSVCGHPRFRGGPQRGHGDKNHRPHHLLVRRDPQRGAAGAEGLRRRLSSITWCGPSPARCSTPPRESSCRRIFRPFWKVGTGRWRDPRCRREGCI